MHLPCISLLVIFTLGAALATNPNGAYTELEDWVISNGGLIDTEIRTNSQGYRGLFTKKPAKAGSYVASIPASVMINAGSVDSNLMAGTLTVLKELVNPDSRFAPYIKTWPKKGEVLNICTFPRQYLPLLESPNWGSVVNNTQDYVEATFLSKNNVEMEWTLQEMIGNAEVTLEDLKYACAVSSTRYVTIELRRRLMMVPIFDMSNHKRLCNHTTSAMEGDDVMHIIVGEDVEAGEELCYAYNLNMRDDYALLNYGFLQDKEDPPRLLEIDHHQFSPEGDHKEFTEQVFITSSAPAAKAEVVRLSRILSTLTTNDKAFDRSKWPTPGEDYVVDLLMELRERRREALRYELKRVAKLASTL